MLLLLGHLPRLITRFIVILQDDRPGLADLEVGVEVVLEEEAFTAEFANVVLLSRVYLRKRTLLLHFVKEESGLLYH